MDVSVVVPSLNEGKEIEKCLKAIKSQDTNLSYELVVSDGHSKDNTVEIAEKYADRVVFADKGIWRGRNAGADASTGDVLVFVDADTRIPRNYVDVVHSALKDETIAAITCGFDFSKKTKKLKAAARLLNGYFFFRYLAGRGTLSGFNLSTTRKVFQRVGGFKNTPLEDGVFSQDASKLGRIVFLPEPRVTTSSRRLESQGLHGTLSYYMQLMLTTDVPDFVDGVSPMQYKEYFPVR